MVKVRRDKTSQTCMHTMWRCGESSRDAHWVIFLQILLLHYISFIYLLFSFWKQPSKAVCFKSAMLCCFCIILVFRTFLSLLYTFFLWLFLFISSSFLLGATLRREWTDLIEKPKWASCTNEWYMSIVNFGWALNKQTQNYKCGEYISLHIQVE